MPALERLLGPCLLSMLAAGALGCPDLGEELKPDEDATEGGSTESGSAGGPAACPDNPDPECVTSNACGNAEICVACECVPEPEGCNDPAAANCIGDDDCADGEVCSSCQCVSMCAFDAAPNECLTDADCDVGPCTVDNTGVCVCASEPECDPVVGDCLGDSDCSANEQCVACECVSTCECDPQDTPCADPAQTCDGCECMACGSGTASPVDPIGNTTPEVIVNGTMLSGNVNGDMAACAEALCVVEIVNDFPEEVFFNASNNPLIDPVFLVPDEGTLPPNSTTVLELQANACNVTGSIEDRIFFQDPIDFIEYGRVDLTIDLMTPGA